MSFNIFYSWQSKTVQKYNRNFIENCLKKAIGQLKKELQDNSPDFYLDRDTKDIPGRPNIVVTLERKIQACDVFVGDVSYVAYTNTDKQQPNRTLKDKIFGKNKWITEGVYSTNVAEELGTANGALKGSERIVTVMNTAFGIPDQINFDSKQYKFPLTYKYDENTSNEDTLQERNQLINGLKKRIRLIFETEHERQKEYFHPFLTWKTWESILSRPFSFEQTEYIAGIFTTIKESINNPKTVFRLCGLSGIGKTRMLFECFQSFGNNQPELLSSKILYTDVREQDDKTVTNKVKDLLLAKENKILIIDNCLIELHIALTNLIINENSELSLITISTDPEEKIAQLDERRATRLLILDNQSCKTTVDQILVNNFGELQPDEQQLLVDFSSGIAFVATLMAANPERGKYQPGTLTREDVVKRLLGPIYTDPHLRAGVFACSLFSKFGFSDDYAFQSDQIATNDDLFSVQAIGVVEADLAEWKKLKFREICKQLYDRQLLEKKGRTYSFRPSPLAVRMAEEWWRSCTITKFERILPFLQEAKLVEGFCEQFRYLKHVENAQAIVKSLCDGFFSLAEVLNTSVGSRLFRSFVYVNPTACSAALTKAFLELPSEVLVNIKDGRRNLVWALEKLCFRPETFDESTKIMAAFSVAENENIGNNATQQFLQLFHIQLPGTAANLEARWSIIEYCLNGSGDFKSLAISAISSALNVGHFSRMGGAEDQGDPVLLEDYRPKRGEVYKYWKNCIGVLEKESMIPGIFQDTTLNILKNRFYGMCVEGAGKLIIPIIETLLKAGHLDRMETRTKIQFILNSGRVFDSLSLEELQRIFYDLDPLNFSEKFKIFVAHPSYDEYVDDDRINDHGQRLSKKVENLSEEFLQQKNQWPNIVVDFMVPHLAEGFNFGKFIGQKADRETARNLVTLLINSLSDATPENRNTSILIGLLSNYPNMAFVRTVFRELLNHPSLKQLAFTLARSTQLPGEDILELAAATAKGIFTSSLFGEFTFGWGLRHLPFDETIEILQKIRAIDHQGKAVAFFILATWTNNDDETSDKYKSLMREMIIQDSDTIFSQLRNSMDAHYYDKILVKLLTETYDTELATVSVDMIIEQSNRFEHFHSKENSFYKILNILQEKYFPILWEKLANMYLNTEKYGMAALNLKSLLGSRHDYNNQSEGILFGGSREKFEIILEWCRSHAGQGLYWISELLPVFGTERSDENEWHPYAQEFINEFGSDKNVLSSISAKLGTYSWTGTVVPKLNSDKFLFEKLLDHPIPLVREWAELNLESLEKRIKLEIARDEDGIF